MPEMDGDTLIWRDLPDTPIDDSIVRTVATPFQHEGGMRILAGNIGRACIKISAVAEERWTIEAHARVFSDQQPVQDAFNAGELARTGRPDERSRGKKW